jgi:hypothetical protein
MRETAKSLHLYFVASAVYPAYSGVQAMLGSEFVAGVILLALGLSYMYLSVQVPKLGKESLGTVKWILIANSILVGIALLASLASSGVPLAIGCVLQLLINWYLFTNAKRLAAETQSQIASTPSPISPS